MNYRILADKSFKYGLVYAIFVIRVNFHDFKIKKYYFNSDFFYQSKPFRTKYIQVRTNGIRGWFVAEYSLQHPVRQ
jgi:hypothetical protein